MEARSRGCPRRDDVIRYLGGELRDGDLCLLCGAGDITTWADDVLAAVGGGARDDSGGITRGLRVRCCGTAVGDRLRRDEPLGPAHDLSRRGIRGPLPRGGVRGRPRRGRRRRRREPACRCSSSARVRTSSSPTTGSPVSPSSSARASPVSTSTAPPCAPVGRRPFPSSPAAPSRPASPASSGPSVCPGSIGGAVRMNAGGPRRRDRRDASPGSASSTSPPGRMAGCRGPSPPPTSSSATGGRTCGAHDRRGRRHPRPRARRPEAGSSELAGDRPLAARQPAGRPERRLGVHEPARRRRRPPRRGGRRQGPPARDGGGERQARQLHPGRPRRPRRRRPRPHASRCGGGSPSASASSSTPRRSWSGSTTTLE